MGKRSPGAENGGAAAEAKVTHIVGAAARRIDIVRIVLRAKQDNEIASSLRTEVEANLGVYAGYIGETSEADGTVAVEFEITFVFQGAKSIVIYSIMLRLMTPRNKKQLIQNRIHTAFSVFAENIFVEQANRKYDGEYPNGLFHVRLNRNSRREKWACRSTTKLTAMEGQASEGSENTQEGEEVDDGAGELEDEGGEDQAGGDGGQSGQARLWR
ncbi:hypothetical protein DFJ73DRAFT_769740 [Zopfochytrium polystomum]|nr:hypothetical protein DFJ73DRAFT_769740 [Zopfochytrium polystomum]